MKYFVNFLSITCVLGFIFPATAQSLRDRAQYEDSKAKVEEQMRKEEREIETKNRQSFVAKIRESAYIVKCQFRGLRDKIGSPLDFKRDEKVMKKVGAPIYLAFVDDRIFEALAENYRGEQYPITSASFQNNGVPYKIKNDAVVWDTTDGGKDPFGNSNEFYPATLSMYRGAGEILQSKCELIQDPKSLFVRR